MADISAFRRLDDREQALVCISVLIDGHDAASYLKCDPKYGKQYSKAATQLAMLAPDVRLSLLPSLLRRVLAKGTS